MSAAPRMCENPCETCAKEGLPILLARYALMPSETGAPKLSSSLAAPELDKVPLGNSARYGLRLLRSGYVYVHDEARRHWDEYFVTADGFLAKMPPRILALKMQARPATEFRCARNGAAPIAGVITIRNPRHATRIWIAFSDVEWTQAVLRKHDDADHRRRHMRCIEIKGGKVAPQPGTAPMEQIQQHVTEFGMEEASAAKAFAKWCPHAYNRRQQAAGSLLQAVQQARPQGGAAIVALHDPVGLAMELAALMEFRKQTFMNHESVTKPRFAASAIGSLEGTIREQAKLELAAAASQQAAQLAANGGVANLLPSYQKMVREAETVTAVQAKEAADRKWREYTHDRTGKPRFDEAASKAWLESYNKGFEKFDAESIAPLARAHVAWMQHPCMVNYMSCNYDSSDLESGAAYTAAVASIFRFTSDKQPSYDLYRSWLQQGDTAAADNLLMRALGFNQDKLLEEIRKVNAAPLDGRAFPSDMLVGYCKDVLEKMPQGGQAAMADLLQSAGGALFRNLDGALKGGPAARALAAVAGMAGVQFTTVEVKGNRGKFVQHMMRAIMQLDPNMKVSANQMSKAVAAQMRLMDIEGVPMSASDKRKWLVVLDRSAAHRSAAAGKTGDALARELAQSLRMVDDLPRLKAEAFKTGLNGTSLNAGSAFVTGLVQSYNFVKLASDYTDGMRHEKKEACARMVTGGVAILGSFGEATGWMLQKFQEARLRNAVGFKASRVPDMLRGGGRMLGLGAGLIMAMMDFLKAGDEEAKGDLGLARAYRGAAFLGGSLAAAFFFSHLLGPIGWIVVGLALIALFVLTAWIEKNKDNKLQEWLLRCHFGTYADRYENHAEEAEQLKRAFA